MENTAAQRDASRNPLFDVVFTLAIPGGGVEEISKSINIEKRDTHQVDFLIAKFDLTLNAYDEGENLIFSFTYCTKLFKKETIERFSNYFKKIVSIAVKNTDMRISDIEIVSEEEKKRILFDFNNTEVDYPKDKTLHRLFEEQVEQRPNQVALLGCKEEVRKLRSEEVKKETAHDECAVPPVQPAPPVRQLSLTYRELNERSNRLAQKKAFNPILL